MKPGRRTVVYVAFEDRNWDAPEFVGAFSSYQAAEAHHAERLAEARRQHAARPLPYEIYETVVDYPNEDVA